MLGVEWEQGSEGAVLRRTSTGFGRAQAGSSLVGTTLVLALVAALAGVALFAVSANLERSHADSCVAERTVVVAAIEAARKANPRMEYPAVGRSSDGLDRVREAGFLPYDRHAVYWRYVTAPARGGPEGLGEAHLARARTGDVAVDRCPASPV